MRRCGLGIEISVHDQVGHPDGEAGSGEHDVADDDRRGRPAQGGLVFSISQTASMYSPARMAANQVIVELHQTPIPAV